MKKLHLYLFAMLALFAVACGGNEDAGGSDEAAAPEPQTIAFDLDTEFAFDQTVIYAEAGQSINVEIDNVDSTVNHSWVLVEVGAVDETSTPDEINDAAISNRANSGEVEAGAETKFSFTAPKEAGTYEYVCSIAGHLGGGMKGQFIVE